MDHLKYFWDKPYKIEERKAIYKQMWYVMLLQVFLTAFFGILGEAGLTALFAMTAIMSMIVMLTYRLEINREIDNNQRVAEMSILKAKIESLEEKLVKVKKK